MGRTSALVNLLVPVAMPVVAIVLALTVKPHGTVAPQTVVGALVACALGGLLVTASKLPRFSAGEFMSFGARGLPVWARVCYYVGYPLLLLGAAVAVLAAARLG